ncbi:hypothetical protein Tco_1432217 [Tanacetum coccineum]
MQIFHVVVNKVHVDYASLLWSDFLYYVMQSKKTAIQYLRFTNDLLTNKIKETQVYKDYVAGYDEVEVLMIQPELVETTQGLLRHLTLMLLSRRRKEKSTPTASVPPMVDAERDDIIEAT